MLALKLILSTVLLCGVAAQIQIEIEDGPIIGSERVDRKNGSFEAYRSIPYARPPIGDLRFADPEEVDSWTEPLDATRDLPTCYQSDFFGTRSGTEDCLYLNVFTPSADESVSRPVMVFLHGGGLGSGSGREDLYNPEFLMPEDVVLVVPNYRLGIFGFFSLRGDDGTVLANAGLKDMVMALKWVQRNIRTFGGNPDMVTVFGESSGAAAVHMLVISPLAKGLFHNAIIQSDTAFDHVSLIPNGKTLAAALEIDSDDTAEILRQLRSLPAEVVEIGSYSKDVIESVFVEGETSTALLTHRPEESLSSSSYNRDVTLLFGYNDAEGIAVDQLRRFIYGQHKLVTDFQEMIPPAIAPLLEPEEAERLAEDIKWFYYGNEEPSEENMLNFITMFTETNYAFPTVRAVRQHVRNNTKPVYLYKFSVDTYLNVYKRRDNISETYDGASHADELGYLFKTLMHLPLVIEPDSIEDKAVDRVVKFWADFARNSKPTADAKEVTRDVLNYIEIGTEETTLGVNPNSAGITFWTRIYEEYLPSSSNKIGSTLIILISFIALLLY